MSFLLCLFTSCLFTDTQGSGAKQPKDEESEVERRISENPGKYKKHKELIDGTFICRLWCLACRTTTSANKSHVLEHEKTKKHLQASETNSKKLREERLQRDHLRDYLQVKHPEGETLPIETVQFRAETVKQFCMQGIALNKLDAMRPYLENISGKSLTTSSHLRDYIPPLLEQEIQKVLDEFKGREIMVIFDGTTHVGEFFCIVFRSCTDKFDIVERVVAMDMYQHGFNHEELLSAVIKVLSEHHVDPGVMKPRRRNGQVLAFQKDRVSVNQCAARILLLNYIGAKDLECMSHTLTHVGEHLLTPSLKKMKQDLCALIKQSYAFEGHWFSVVGSRFRQPGDTRWWATYECVYAPVRTFFDLVVECINSAVIDADMDEGGARIARLVASMADPALRAEIKFEADIVCIVMKPLVETTYLLEGKGPCAAIAADAIGKIKLWFDVHHPALTYPGVEHAMSEFVNKLKVLPHPVAAMGVPLTAQQTAMVASLADPNATALKTYVRTRTSAMILPAIEYFRSRILVMMETDVTLYKALRNISPIAVARKSGLGGFSVNGFKNEVRSLDHFTDIEVDAMAAELPAYIQLFAHNAQCPTFEEEMDFVVRFWKSQAGILPQLAKLARYAFTIITSSAACERAFSILQRFFGSDKKLALEDYVKLSVMLRSNNSIR